MTASPPALSGTSATLEGWFDWQGGVALMRDGTAVEGAGWILAYDSGGSLAFRLGGTSFTTGLAAGSVRDGWHYFAATKDGPDVAFYLDGQLRYQATGAGNAAPVMPWHVMRDGRYAKFTRGHADEIATYNVALAARTVQEHYDAGASLSQP
jgi:hypothetical protein